jgi:hypothetical protein
MTFKLCQTQLERVGGSESDATFKLCLTQLERGGGR